MPLMPKRVKFRKFQRGTLKGNATRGNTVAYGEYGLQSLQRGWIKATQLEAGRVAAAHYLSNEGRLFVRVFPHRSVTARPPETRMGKGKGEPSHWVAVVKPGTVIYEVGGVDENTARECFSLTAHKLPVRVRMLRRHKR